MHELSLVKNMIGILDREVASDDIGEIKTIHLEVGVLRYVVPELMVSAFENVPKDKKLVNAGLKIDVLPVNINCLDCKKTSAVFGNEYKCPECRSDNIRISGGDEFIVKGIEW